MFTLLLAVDTDERRAKAIAEAVANYPIVSDNMELVIVHVHHEVRGDEGGTIRLKEYSDSPESLKIVTDHLNDKGIEAEIVETSGKPHEEVLALAHEIDADQIVVSGRKHSPVGKAIFGSVAQTIILNSDRPVLTVNVSD